MKRIVETTCKRDITSNVAYVKDYFTYYDNGYILKRCVRNCLDGFEKKGYLFLSDLDKQFIQVYVEKTVPDSLVSDLLKEFKSIFSNTDTYDKVSAKAKLLGLNSDTEFNEIVETALKYKLYVFLTYDDFSSEKYLSNDGFSTIFICNQSELSDNELIFNSIKSAFNTAKRNGVNTLDGFENYTILAREEPDSYFLNKPTEVASTSLKAYIQSLFDETGYSIHGKIGVFLNESDNGSSCCLFYEVNGEKHIFIDYFNSGSFQRLDDVKYASLLRKLRRNGGFFIGDDKRIKWC